MKVWLVLSPLLVCACAFFCACLRTRRIMARFEEHLEGARGQLDACLHHRRNLIPTLITAAAGLRGLEQAYLETLDNAAELVVRARGFDERLVAENRLSSALSCLRGGLGERPDPALTGLIYELDERETGIRLGADLFNRQIDAFNTLLRSSPYRWFAPLCGFKPKTKPVAVRLSTTPCDAARTKLRSKEPES